jgi:hypothetical protein
MFHHFSALYPKGNFVWLLYLAPSYFVWDFQLIFALISGQSKGSRHPQAGAGAIKWPPKEAAQLGELMRTLGRVLPQEDTRRRGKQPTTQGRARP